MFDNFSKWFDDKVFYKWGAWKSWKFLSVLSSHIGRDTGHASVQQMIISISQFDW